MGTEIKRDEKWLEGQAWYRLLQVIYLGTFLLSIPFGYGFGGAFVPSAHTDSMQSGYSFAGIMVAIGLMWLIKKAFLYIVIGPGTPNTVPWYQRLTWKQLLFISGVFYSLSMMQNDESIVLGLTGFFALIYACIEGWRSYKLSKQKT